MQQHRLKVSIHGVSDRTKDKEHEKATVKTANDVLHTQYTDL
jgi:hypothetical protein